MTGSGNSPPLGTDDLFYLDECLPYQIADALRLVGYPITSWKLLFGEEGKKDEHFIPELSKQRLVWITKDDESRLEHQEEIEKYHISVVWVRGIQRSKKQKDGPTKPRMKDVHRMLVNKLDDIAAEVNKAKGPRYFILYLKVMQTKLLTFTTLKDVTGQLQNQKRRFSPPSA